MKSNEHDVATPFSPAPRFVWPQGHRCAAMLCFDVDGETTALSEDATLARRRTLMSQCEYGPKIGVPKRRLMRTRGPVYRAMRRWSWKVWVKS